MAGGESCSIKSNSGKQEGKRKKTKTKREVFFPHLFSHPFPAHLEFSLPHWGERGVKGKEHSKKRKSRRYADRGSQDTGVPPLTAGGAQGTAPPASLGPQRGRGHSWAPLLTSFLVAKVFFRNTNSLKTAAQSHDLSLSLHFSGSYSEVSV